ncbi:1-phosphofructokinase [Spiroplasma helicoides]|uniref:1-phosphofructokinase n=1 Tax=Spiroplasma helicoides TaxID=216938 RepID=A0A1B3SKK2_9MOLU|nr:1-phosphofructokinase family hexose kinase [Spiroplasma helicoides]AOG60446.1 1-phosphofructokinase [Spiroplasma helicoides]
MANNIYVISLSPAIDYILKFDDFIKDKTNRPYYTEMYAAGKGIHISMLLNNLGLKNESIIFSNGSFEEYFYKDLDSLNINYKKFKANGDIRINLKLIDSNQTECSVKSPSIDDQEIEKMFEYLEKNVQKNDYIIATGSIPKGVDENIYSKIAKLAQKLEAYCVVDAFGKALLDSLNHKPFLIKPNKDELSLTFNKPINTQEDAIGAAKKLIELGAQNVIVSMGSEGAILINKDKIIKSSIGKWNKSLVNAAGAGDSMLGGFIYNYIKTQKLEDSLKMGITCGSATAFSNKIASKELIDELLLNIDTIKIENLL